MVDLLRENDSYVCHLRNAIAEGKSGLSDVPALVRRIVDEGRWQLRTVVTGEKPKFRHFEEFVGTPPLEGLGASLDILIRLCKDDKDALDAIDRAIQKTPRQGKRTDLVDIINEVKSSPDGTSEQAAIRRLRKERPDLLDRVKQGSLSAHAAMIEGGYREKLIQVSKDPVKAARKLIKHFRGDCLEALIRELSEGL